VENDEMVVYNHTCTCLNFRSLRRGIHYLNPSQCCKHVCTALSERVNSWPEVNSLIGFVIARKAG